ncbi:clusterin-like protein 1 [Oryzias latipes]|uniref:clusterin-like protein 1 n=1 Tax=Oryzias latipes TaxID=8090 RepID=UPI0005CB8549|nr:clusterin-like protein 1 [Oryzias latipes]
MQKLSAPVLCMAVVVLYVAASPSPSEDVLKKLSTAGEQYLEEEIKQTFLGVKQVKVMMEKKEEKHKRLMEALKHGSNKKMGVTQLAKEMEHKLEEAEQQCRESTKSSLEECKPCLEDTCKAFYASTCRRGFASFSFKVDEFFRKMVTQAEAVYDQNQDKATAAENQITEDKTNLEVLQAEASFSQLLSNISILYNHSVTVVKKMQEVFGHSFLADLSSELQISSPSAAQDGSTSGFFKTFSLDHLLVSAYDFGKEVLEEFSSSMSDMMGDIQGPDGFSDPPSRDAGSLSAFEQPSGSLCRRLRRQASECWKLQDLCEACKDNLIRECPHVQQLHAEMEEMQTLLNASRLQYNDRLLLVQRHTADTQRWLTSMQDKYAWVTQLLNTTVDPSSTFTVITLSQEQKVKNSNHATDSSVAVSILGSAPVKVLVTAELQVDDPAFIQYVAQEALKLQKQQIRGLK